MDRDHDSEKADLGTAHELEAQRTSSNGIRDEASFDFTPEEKRKIIHRVDRRLVTTVGAMYCVSLMDRTNLGAAINANMGKELLLIDNRYVRRTECQVSIFQWLINVKNIITLVFFVTYILIQPPSTILVRKIGPRMHLAAITIAWGAVMIGMGFVKSWTDMVGLRVLLGIFEAGYFPSCVYLLSTWYTRYEVGKRYSAFYLLGCVASAFAGILAYGLMHMDGLSGLTGWRWIFVIEGLITCLLGIAGYWLLVDFPDSHRSSWRFLNNKEREWIVARVEADRGDARVMPFSWPKFLRAGADPKIWGFAMIFFNTTTVTYALAYFLPVILNLNMGFDAGVSNCLVAPPYAFAGIVMFLTAWVGDRYKLRGPIIVFNMVLCLIGLPIMGFHPKSAVRYFGVFLTTAGANANVPATMAYQANNIRGQWKRACCSATLVAFGGLGGIAGSLVFRTQDGPFYKPGLYACIACCLLNIVIVSVLSMAFRFLNGKADKGEKELESSDEDYQPGFRYTY